MKKMNKRGNLPIIILVLGVLAVCALALLSFYVSNFKVSNSFSGIKLVEKLNSQIEVNLYQGELVDGLHEEKDILKPKLLNPLNREVIFSVTYDAG